MGWVSTVDKREAILNAAQHCMKAHSLKNLNIRDVAKEAGVSLGSVHYYFSSKEQILMELFQKFVSRVSEATLTGTPHDNPRQVLLGFVDGYFTEVSKDPAICQGFIDLWDHATTNQELRRLLESYYQRSIQWLSKLIKDGKQRGLFHVESPASAAAQIIAVIDGIKVQLHLHGTNADVMKLKKGTRRFILNALGAREEGE